MDGFFEDQHMTDARCCPLTLPIRLSDSRLSPNQLQNARAFERRSGARAYQNCMQGLILYMIPWSPFRIFFLAQRHHRYILYDNNINRTISVCHVLRITPKPIWDLAKKKKWCNIGIPASQTRLS